MISRGKHRWLRRQYWYLVHLKNPLSAPFAKSIRDVTPRRMRDMRTVLVDYLRKAAIEMYQGATYDEAIKAATAPYPSVLGKTSSDRARSYSENKRKRSPVLVYPASGVHDREGAPRDRPSDI